MHPALSCAIILFAWFIFAAAFICLFIGDGRSKDDE